MQKDLDRFWIKVKKSTEQDCWEWTACTGRGYGLFHHEGKMTVAHRVSWHLTNGPIPDGLKVLHKCDNRPCVNPNHLFLGTLQDNAIDMVSKGRNYCAAGEKHGLHKLTSEQVIEIRRSRPLRKRKDLAAEFGVSVGCISAITQRKRWQHLP